MNKMSNEQTNPKQKNQQVCQQMSPKLIKDTQENIQTPIKQNTSNSRINPSYNQLSESPNNVPPYKREDGKLDPNEIELGLQPEAAIKRKKVWKSWSSQEKIMFYEIIANGGNYSSLQKLFKTMNDKIGSKSTEKIRDYYYRMLKNVNTLLKSAGEMGLNSKNRDEVILAIGCYGKLLNSPSKKYKLDMKKLNKHPRLFKRIANTLKKLITKQIKMVRTKKINNLSSSGNKATKTKLISKSVNNSSHNIQRPGKPALATTNNETNDFPRIINVTSSIKIPYETFIMRITPYDKETYLKMIMENYCPRLEISVSSSKPIKYIIDTLTDKWKNIPKNNAKNHLYLLPIQDIWLPKQLTFFSALDNGKAYIVADIYTAYGNPSTNILYMYYQWVEVKNDLKAQAEIVNNLLNPDCVIDNNSNKNKYLSNNENQYSNFAIKNENSFEDDISEDEEQEQEQEKSFMPLESELNIFDPLEFLGLEDEKKNSTDEEEEPIRDNNPAVMNHFTNRNIFISKKSAKNNRSNSPIDTTNNNANNTNNLNKNNNNSKLRTDYSELFSHSECGLLLTNKSNQNNSNMERLQGTKRKIPFSNNVNKRDLEVADHFFTTSLRNLNANSNSNSLKEEQVHYRLEEQIKENKKAKIIKDQSKELQKQNEKNMDKKHQSPHRKTKQMQSPRRRIQPIPFNNNINKNSIIYPTSNFGLTALFQNDQNTKMLNNNTNIIEASNNPEISNFINQNSLNFNSIFEYDYNNNTNIDIFKQNFTSTNIFKMEYPNNNSSNYNIGHGNGNNNPQPNNINDYELIDRDKPNDTSTKQKGNNVHQEDNKNKVNLNKKTKRPKERKKREKITIDEIEEIERIQRMKKQKNAMPQQSTSSCIINQNNYFNYPGQYYPQISANMSIPLPSNFFKEQSSAEQAHDKQSLSSL